MEYVFFLVIGAMAGWIAGLLMKSNRSDLLTNIIVGVVGAILGGWLCGVAGIAPTNKFGALLVATGGACILIAGLRAIKSR